MPKIELLFVVHQLSVGGVQKSLISALKAINYEKYNVTLYVRNNRLDIAQFIDERVNVVVNTIDRRYYRLPYAVLLQIKSTFFGAFDITKRKDLTQKKLAQYICKRKMDDEAKKHFYDKKYDIAVSYIQSHTALFVEQYVKADKKIVFYQGSTDECHEVNEIALPMFDRIAVEHSDIKQLMMKWYKKLRDNQFFILENYTDYKLLKQQSREYTVKTFEDKTTLCTCSRFTLVKGVDLAIEAAKILRNKQVKFIWYLVGDGSEMGSIQSLIAKYNLEDYVFLPGMQKNPYPYMAACDIYVQPSREEALSISMLESQMLCAPMVSTKTAGGLAMIQEGVNGLLADINAKSLAETIETFIQNDGLRNSIQDYLSSIDYSDEEIRYKNDWKNLLEI